MKTINLADKIIARLPGEMVALMRSAGELAASQGQELYLVGGVVRDLLLGRRNLDLDLVLEGDAIALAQALARTQNAGVTAHRRFGTAKLKWDDWSADLATARAETYACPGALPSVKPGAIVSDLARRDFTINAMAIRLNEGHFGELLDPHGGMKDLDKRLIRVLHDRSFIDDATRIWRALRYEQRLDFNLEPATLRLLKRDMDNLDTVSGDRTRHELEHVLEEALPDKALRRAGELGVLGKLHPSLLGDGWLAEKFARARLMSLPSLPPPTLYTALLAYRLAAGEIEQLIACLRLPKLSAQTLRDTIAIKGKIEALAVRGLAPSRIHAHLHGHAAPALRAASIATESATAAEHIELYINVLSHVKPALTGEDLKRMGVPAGPEIREILERLREARLDGKAGSKKDEEKMVRGWVKETNQPSP